MNHFISILSTVASQLRNISLSVSFLLSLICIDSVSKCPLVLRSNWPYCGHSSHIIVVNYSDPIIYVKLTKKKHHLYMWIKYLPSLPKNTGLVCHLLGLSITLFCFFLNKKQNPNKETKNKQQEQQKTQNILWWVRNFKKVCGPLSAFRKIIFLSINL